MTSSRLSFLSHIDQTDGPTLPNAMLSLSYVEDLDADEFAPELEASPSSISHVKFATKDFVPTRRSMIETEVLKSSVLELLSETAERNTISVMETNFANSRKKDLITINLTPPEELVPIELKSIVKNEEIFILNTEEVAVTSTKPSRVSNHKQITDSDSTKDQLTIEAENEGIFHVLPDELLLEVIQYLDQKSQLMFCTAANRKMRRVWGLTLGCFSRSLKTAQSMCTEYGYLTEIASDGQKDAQNDWSLAKDRKMMLLHDARLFERNEGRFRVDLDFLESDENSKLRKFQVCVDVLAQTMEMWKEKSATRDEETKRCAGFFKSFKSMVVMK